MMKKVIIALLLGALGIYIYNESQKIIIVKSDTIPGHVKLPESELPPGVIGYR